MNVIKYLDEADFEKKVRALKRQCVVAFKDLYFVKQNYTLNIYLEVL